MLVRHACFARLRTAVFRVSSVISTVKVLSKVGQSRKVRTKDDSPRSHGKNLQHCGKGREGLVFFFGS
jgi:hypothetical protein